MIVQPTSRGVTPTEFTALAGLFMSDDGDRKILNEADDELLRDWFDSQARLLGFDNWVEAYHAHGVPS